MEAFQHDALSKMNAGAQYGSISIKEFSYPEDVVRVHLRSEDCSGDFNEQYKVGNDYKV